MNHSIVVNGEKFFTAQVVDAYEKKTYDMTVIFNERGDELPPRLVNYYYGDPNESTTAHYAHDYLSMTGGDHNA